SPRSPMLTPPALTTHTIIDYLHEAYGLRVLSVAFLPLGADVNTAVYRIIAEDGVPHFLKLRRGDFDEVTVTVPAFLHAQGIRSVLAPLTTATRQLWASGHGYAWIVYPYQEGHNGFEVALSETQWAKLGKSLRAVHATTLPVELRRRVPSEHYSSRW